VLSWPPTLPSTRALIIAVAVVIVVALAALGGWAWYDASHRRTSVAYAEVMARAQAADAPDTPADAAVIVRSASCVLARIASTVESMLTTMPRRSPRDGAAPTPTTSRPPPGRGAATMAQTLVVPTSRPTISSGDLPRLTAPPPV